MFYKEVIVRYEQIMSMNQSHLLLMAVGLLVGGVLFLRPFTPHIAVQADSPLNLATPTTPFSPGLSARITILSDADFSTHDWTGTGTVADPYLLANRVFSLNNGEAGLFIRDTRAFFRVQNCTFQNGEIGIYLNNVMNGFITKNTIANNKMYGVQIADLCENITLHANLVRGNTYRGIVVGGTSDLPPWYNTLIANLVEYSEIGIFLSDSEFNSVINNTCRKNSHNGIWVNSAAGLLENNTCIVNGHSGILLDSAATTTRNNICVRNKYGISISPLSADSPNLLTRNYLANNTAYQALDNGTQRANTWTKNFYGDYIGTDTDGDGYGDTAYLIPGNAGAKDKKPLITHPALITSSLSQTGSTNNATSGLLGAIALLSLGIGGCISRSRKTAK